MSSPTPAIGGGDVAVVSFRNHHHTFDMSDQKHADVHFHYHDATPSAVTRLVQFSFCMIVVHYFWWSVIMIGSLVALWWTGHWWLAIALLSLYLPSFLNKDQLKCGRPWHWARRHKLWDLVNKYLQTEVVRLEKLDESKRYIFGVYPHGILILSRCCQYGGIWEQLFGKIDVRVLGASPMFHIPGSREICLWMSAVDANRRTAENVLTKYNKSVMVYPGGSSEIFLTDPNNPKTILVARKGFIKLALQTGTDIVPTFVFGEKFLYHRRPLPSLIKRFFMATLRLPLILFWGRYFTWLPYHDKKNAFLSVVFGHSIKVQQIAYPTDADIDGVYQQYMSAIKHLYHDYKDRYGYSSDEELEVRDADEMKRAKQLAKQAKQKQAAEEKKNGHKAQ